MSLNELAKFSKALLKPTGKFDTRYTGNVLAMASLSAKNKAEFKEQVKQDKYDKKALKAMLLDKCLVPKK